MDLTKEVGEFKKDVKQKLATDDNRQRNQSLAASEIVCAWIRAKVQEMVDVRAWGVLTVHIPVDGGIVKDIEQVEKVILRPSNFTISLDSRETAV